MGAAPGTPTLPRRVLVRRGPGKDRPDLHLVVVLRQSSSTTSAMGGVDRPAERPFRRHPLRAGNGRRLRGRRRSLREEPVRVVDGDSVVRRYPGCRGVVIGVVCHQPPRRGPGPLRSAAPRLRMFAASPVVHIHADEPPRATRASRSGLPQAAIRCGKYHLEAAAEAVAELAATGQSRSRKARRAAGTSRGHRPCRRGFPDGGQES